MNNFTKIVACLYVGIIASSAETLTFDGTQESLGGFINIDFKDGYKIKKVQINNDKVDEWCKNNNKEFKEITLVIPGSVGNNQIWVGDHAFSQLQSDKLRLKLKFQSRNYRVAFPEDCRWLFAGSSSLTDIDLSGVVSYHVWRASGMFFCCRNLETINFENFDTSNIQDMCRMFASCTNLEQLNLKMFDTRRVHNMTQMFANCRSLAQLDLWSFDTHNVKNSGGMLSRGMSEMFYGCANLSQVNIDPKKFTWNKENGGEHIFDECPNILLK